MVKDISMDYALIWTDGYLDVYIQSVDYLTGVNRYQSFQCDKTHSLMLSYLA